MPITKSAKKALRQSIRRRERNLERKEAFKSVFREIKKFVAAGKVKDAELLISKAYKALDKAAKTNAIKKNTAARKKSRLMDFLRKQKAVNKK